jgi:hypothetical protein
MPRRFLTAFGLTVVIVGSTLAQTRAQSSERVKEDSSRATPAGTTFRVPAGWTVTSRAAMVVLEPPEADSHVAIVDVRPRTRTLRQPPRGPRTSPSSSAR